MSTRIKLYRVAPARISGVAVHAVLWQLKNAVELRVTETEIILVARVSLPSEVVKVLKKMGFKETDCIGINLPV